MSDALRMDLFVEDRAQESFLEAMVARIAAEKGKDASVRPRSARGGHGKTLAELKLYQRVREIQGERPDVLLVAVDANCRGFTEARDEIISAIEADLFPRRVLAVPDPHIERWYMADPKSLFRILGAKVKPGRRKCERDVYKNMLLAGLREAGQVLTAGVSVFAREIVEGMDLYQAGKNEKSLKHFLDDLRAALT